MFIIAGKNISKNIGEENIEEEVQQAETEAEEIRKPENVVSLLQVDPIELEFGYGIIPLADVNQGGDLLDRVVMIDYSSGQISAYRRYQRDFFESGVCGGRNYRYSYI